MENELPAPADQLAVAVLALSNGIAIEQLADPDTVDPSVFGTTLGLLLNGLAKPTPSRDRMRARTTTIKAQEGPGES
jgi:hypothetical protein